MPAAPHSRSAALALVLAAGSVVFCWTGVAVIAALVAGALLIRGRASVPAGDRSMRLAAMLLAVAGLVLSLLVGGLVLAGLLRR